MERVSSIFSQILKFFPRTIFEKIVADHQGDKHSKGMSCWSQLVALLFCHLGGARSLREIVGGLAASEGKLRHLGIDRAPTRSTLAYANEHRPWQIYREVFQQLLLVCQADAASARRKFRFRNPLLSLDSTLISVCLSMFDWARYSQTKGAVKVHLILNHQGYLPQFAVITDGKTADVKIARQMAFAPGTMLVMDRGYEHHQWWRRLSLDGVYFVSRLKDSTGYTILRERPVTDGILRDEEITLDSEKNLAEPMRLRRIEIWVEDKQDTLVFITNHPRLAASTIAAIYKDRWQIELFFKAIKQSLRIRTFIGTSENAVHIQIWTALIAILLVRYLQLRSTWKWSLSNLVALLRQQLFEQSGRSYVMIEGTDAIVHFIDYTQEIEEARSRGDLRINSFVRLRKRGSRMEIDDLGDAEKLLSNRHYLNQAAREHLKRGAPPTEDGWGGWLGRYKAALTNSVGETQTLARQKSRSHEQVRER